MNKPSCPHNKCMSCLRVNATEYLSKSQSRQMNEWGVTGESIPVGWIVSKIKDQSIGDPFRVNGAEFPSSAPRFLSSSHPVRRPEGDGGTQGAGCEEVDTERKKRIALLQRCLQASSHSLSLRLV